MGPANAKRAAVVGLLVAFFVVEWISPARSGRMSVDRGAAVRVVRAALEPHSEVARQMFVALAVGTDDSVSAMLRKWNDPVRVVVHGAPTPADLEQIRQTVAELTEHTGHAIELDEEVRSARTAAATGALSIYFVSPVDFPRIDDNASAAERSWYWLWWTSRGAIVKARVLIATELAPAARHKQLRELAARSLGLPFGSRFGRDSIFTNPSRSTYSALDEQILALLYDRSIASGIPGARVRAALSAHD